MKRWALKNSLLVMLFAGHTHAGASVIRLQELLPAADTALQVMQAEQELESARHGLDRERADQGWRAFSSVGYGRVRDVIDKGRTRSFSSAKTRIGVNYPLLGSAEKDAREIDAASGRVGETRVRHELALQQARMEIATLYANYWAAQERLVVIDAMSGIAGDSRSRLKLRRDEHMLRESEYRNTLLLFEQVQVDADRYEQQQQVIRQRLEQLLDRHLGDFTAYPVPLSPPPQLEAKLLEAHPSLRILDHRRRSLTQQLENSNWYGVDADVEISTSAVRDTTAHQSGGGAFIGLNLSAPIAIMGARDSERKRLTSMIEALKLQQRDEHQKLITEARSLRTEYQHRLQAIDYSAQAVASSASLLKERQLRGDAFTDENVVSLIQAMQQYYRNALQDIDSRNQAWLAFIQAQAFTQLEAQQLAANDPRPGPAVGERLAQPLLQLAAHTDSGFSATLERGQEDGQAVFAKPVAYSGFSAQPAVLVESAEGNREGSKTRVSRVAQQTSPAPLPMAAYVWNSDDLVVASPPAAFWSTLQQQSMDRVLLSLNQGQIDRLGRNPGPLQAFLQAAHDRAVTVELLLGDPHWIEPQHRGKLVDIIQGLQVFDFDGLHLDIEPHQIYQEPLSTTQFENWLATLAAAAEAAPWPTAVDVHPRYFLAEPYPDWNLDERLAGAGVEEVVLMVYQSNPERVAEIVSAVAVDAPDLRFRVAQSVEPQLPPNLSYAQSSPTDFRANMQRLMTLLQDQSNVEGIVVQAWTDLMRMNDES